MTPKPGVVPDLIVSVGPRTCVTHEGGNAWVYSRKRDFWINLRAAARGSVIAARARAMKAGIK